MKLTKHFALTEFTQSQTATRNGIPNGLDPSHPEQAEVIANLKALCEEVLEPLRQQMNTPIVITSGYRCPKLNAAVGGAGNSQHTKGEAADLHLPDEETGRKWFLWIKDHLPFDQLIWERATPTSPRHWIHVSHSRRHNRQMVIANLCKQ